jgi:hypothetical protein
LGLVVAFPGSNQLPTGTEQAAIARVASGRYALWASIKSGVTVPKRLLGQVAPCNCRGSRRKHVLMADVIIIEAGLQERNYWRDLWRYRELFYVLAWRDLSVRYKQTVIGAAWAVIRPVLTMVIFTVIFGRIAKLPSDGDTPYPLMVFAGMLPWTFFASSLSEASAA